MANTPDTNTGNLATPVAELLKREATGPLEKIRSFDSLLAAHRVAVAALAAQPPTPAKTAAKPPQDAQMAETVALVKAHAERYGEAFTESLVRRFPDDAELTAKLKANLAAPMTAKDKAVAGIKKQLAKYEPQPRKR